jgi:hypothetical protein
MTTPEGQIEEKLIEKLLSLKYEYRQDIRDRAALEKNFREKFEALNRVRLTEREFAPPGRNHHPGCLHRRPHPARAQQLHP